jgi:hypothetical protein
MDYMAVLRDAIATSVSMQMFLDKNNAALTHVFNAKLTKFLMSHCKNKLENFNPDRLQPTAVKAYPLSDRPRGEKDISSVKFYQKQLKEQKDIPAIWIIKDKSKYILLDGAHRIVASYIENKKYIDAYIVNMPDNTKASGKKEELTEFIKNTKLLKSLKTTLDTQTI